MSDERPLDAGLARSSAIMAVGTVLSRLSGFVRAAVIAAVLGVGVIADVFTVPNTIPNALYILVAGGVLNSVLVPQLVRAMKNDPDGGAAYAERLMTAATIVLVAASAAAVLAAPWLLRLYVDERFLEPELRPLFDSMVLIARFTLPQILFYGLFVLLGQVLNARGRFGPMMFAPILNNLVVIALFLTYFATIGSKGSAQFSRTDALWLGLGSTLGIAVQAVALIPYLRGTGIRLRPRLDLRGSGLGKAARLGGWTVAFVALNQVSLLIVVRLSTTGTAAATGSGQAAGLAAYQNAFLLVMVPHAVLTVSLATALLPAMSRQAADGDLLGVGESLSSAMRTCLAVIAPLALLLAGLAGPLAALLFGYGAAAGQTGQVAQVLLAFAPGLLGFTLHYLTLRGFYALEDTRTPFLVQFAVAGTNIVAAIVITTWLTRIGEPGFIAVGLAASWSLSYVVGSAVSMSVLSRRVAGLRPGMQVVKAGHALLAALPGTLAVAAVAQSGLAEIPRVLLAPIVLVAAALAGLLYLITSRLLRLREPAEVIRLLLRRGRPGPPSGPGRPGGSGPGPTGTSDGTEGPGPTGTADRPGSGAAAGSGPYGGPVARSEAVGRSPWPRGVLRERLASGDRLQERYQLDELLAEDVAGLASWRAHDHVLERPVLVRTLPTRHPRASDLVLAARRAALASDPRLLRVLDADVTESITRFGPAVEQAPASVTYLVREWVDGRSLADLVSEGPLSTDDAISVALEVARALGQAHREGLGHGRVLPGDVIITPDGAVKLAGLETALAGRPLAALHADRDGLLAHMQRSDVRAIGRVLYVGLTGRWPVDPEHPHAHIEPVTPAPVSDGRPVLPHQVRAGIPRHLDDLVARLLDSGRRPHAAAVRSADDAVDALIAISPGHADGTIGLIGSPVHAAVLALPGGASHPGPRGVTVERAHPGGLVQELHTDAAGLTSARPGGRPDGARAGRRPAATPALAIAVVTLLLSGAVLFALQAVRPRQGPAPTNPSGSEAPTMAPSLRARLVAGATDFDPFGDGSENAASTSAAFDNDLASAWRTSTYYTEMSRQKAGVGLVLDLGSPVPVSQVTLHLLGSPSDVEIRAAGADTPPDRLDGWTRHARAARAGSLVPLAFREPVVTQYLLVWFTELPQVPGGWRGGVRAVEVRG